MEVSKDLKAIIGSSADLDLSKQAKKFASVSRETVPLREK
jgi:hypothetical protein